MAELKVFDQYSDASPPVYFYIMVVPENDNPPVLSPQISYVIFTEGGGSISAFDTEPLRLSDQDCGQLLQNATVHVDSSGEDDLVLNAISSQLTVVWHPSEGLLKINGTALLAEYAMVSSFVPFVQLSFS